MSFSTKPVVKNLTEEEKQRLKPYGYSEIHAYDVAFLGESKDIIIANLPEELREEAKKRMDKVDTFIIGDRKKVGLSNLCQSGNTIHMDIGYANISADSFELKPESEFITTILVHELLHAASSPRRGTTGIVEKTEDGKKRKNVGLNEGITQFLAEKYTGRNIEPDNYSFHKKAVGLLADVIGADFIQTAYLTNDVNALRTRLNQVAGNDTFFDEFAAQLDTINRLSLATKKIKKGLIEPKDPESVTRMEAVLEASQDKLSEMLFVNVVLPTITAAPLESRQTKLLELFQSNSAVLDAVSKYIPLVKNQVSEGSVVFVDLTNEKLTMMAEEIKVNGMSFDSVKKQADRVKEGTSLGTGVARDVMKAADEFYKNNQEYMRRDKKEMTPFLQRELSHYVDIYLTLEETAANDPKIAKSVAGYKDFIKHYFHKIENIDTVIDAMITTRKEEKKKTTVAEGEEVQVTQPQTPVTTPVTQVDPKRVKTTDTDTEDIDLGKLGDQIEELGRQRGEQDADQAFVKPNEENKKKIPSIKDDFIVNNVTGEIIDMRGKTVRERIRACIIAAGDDYVLLKDPFIDEQIKEGFEDVKATQIPKPGTQEYEDAIRKYGSENKALTHFKQLENAMLERYEAGYRRGISSQLDKTIKQAKEEREKGIDKVNTTGKVDSEQRPFTPDEIKTVMEYITEEVDDNGNIHYLNTSTDIDVVDQRTIAAYKFGKEITYALGEVATESGEIKFSVQEAFKEENLPVVSAFLKIAKQDVEKHGFVDMSQFEPTADTDERLTRVAQRFESNPDIIEQVGRAQTKNAIENPKKTQAPEMGEGMGAKK